MPNDSFYKTPQWKKVRSAVIRHWRHWDLPCGYCGKDLDWFTRFQISVDHKINRKQRPDLALDETNLHVVHQTCNSKKAAWEEHSKKPEIGEDGFPINSEWQQE